MNGREEDTDTLPGAPENIETHYDRRNSRVAAEPFFHDIKPTPDKDCNENFHGDKETELIIVQDEHFSVQLEVSAQRKHYDSVSSGHSTEFYVTGLSEFSEDLVTKYESAESFESLEYDKNVNIPTIVIDLVDSDSYDGSTDSVPSISQKSTDSSEFGTSQFGQLFDESQCIDESELVVDENTVAPAPEVCNSTEEKIDIQTGADSDKLCDAVGGKTVDESLEDGTQPNIEIDEETGEQKRQSEKHKSSVVLEVELGDSSNLEDTHNTTQIREPSPSEHSYFRVLISNDDKDVDLTINVEDVINNQKKETVKQNHTMRRRREEGSGDHDESEDQLIDGELRESYRVDRQLSDEWQELEIRGDEWNIALLLALYLLQGVPLGLTTAIPMIIQNKGVSFKQQAEFSFTTWPFALKLVWAPLVDSLFFPSFGRRKTWLVPAQYLIGFFMVFLSFNIETWLSSEGPQVSVLTWMFFAMNFLAATQDIAVDGWALTMLKRQNKSLASTCNSIGQSAGFFLGYVIFIALESPSFCNSYLRSEPSDVGIVTITGFLYFWGLLYLLLTTLVALFKRETTGTQTERPSTKAAFKSYATLLRIFKLSNIRLFVVLLLTVKIGFAAFDGVTSLKFIANGVPKDKLAILAVPLVPLQIILPVFITKMNNPRRPMDLFLKAYPYRLAFNLVGVLFVYVTPLLIKNNEDIPYYFYISLVAILAVHQISTSAMFVQQMAFFAMVSDVNSGGTYMTLLNTVANLGSAWTTTSALATVDSVTYYSCAGSNLTLSNDCSNKILKQECSAAGGSCDLIVDGYYVQQLILTIVGILWFWYGRKKIDYLQNRPLSTWAVPRR